MTGQHGDFRHDTYLVGFKPIDDLHREFQSILNCLNDPREGDYGEDLLALHEHWLRHTETEERFMLQENYPHYERHRGAHEALLESISEARRRCDGNDLDAVRSFCAELMDWFAVHTEAEDAVLAAYLRGEA